MMMTLILYAALLQFLIKNALLSTTSDFPVILHGQFSSLFITDTYTLKHSQVNTIIFETIFSRKPLKVIENADD